MPTRMSGLLPLPLPLPTLIADAHADEGFWQPAQLPALSSTLKQRGLAMDPMALSRPNAYPLGAVVSLGFCTASFVSPDGLMVTAHHCGAGVLQYDSTSTKNLVVDGFLAGSRPLELPAPPSLRAYVTQDIRDVTNVIDAAAEADRNGVRRDDAIDLAEKALVLQCEKPDLRCEVKSVSEGDRYELIAQRQIQDIRLVYAPPQSIGDFGGDIDNFMWPRHTGDFSFLRAYVAKDGHSAPYSKQNAPFHPTHWLTINPNGTQAGDFVMVAGYPSHTERYRLADELQSAVDWQYPTTIKIDRDQLARIDAAGNGHPDIAFAYANTITDLKNAARQLQGRVDGLIKENAVATKRTQEAAMEDWLTHRSAQGDREADADSQAVAALKARVDSDLTFREQDLTYGLLMRVALFKSAYQLVRLAEERQKPELEREAGYQQRDENPMLNTQEQLQRQMDATVDQQLMVDALLRYLTLPPDQRFPAMDNWLADAHESAAVAAKVARLYRDSALTETWARVSAMHATPGDLHRLDDSWLRLMTAIMPDLRSYEEQKKIRVGDEAALRPRYMAALIRYRAANALPFYPDANGSLRVTFGKVAGYRPRDAVVAEPYTTALGIVQKSTGTRPFDAPDAELEAIQHNAFDGYASPTLGGLPVDFLSTLDISGGNSGSPTLDKDGRFVGLAFDVDWEGVSTGWLFNPDQTRAIQVDVRYMLWVMHHLSHADNVLQEMGVPPPK